MLSETKVSSRFQTVVPSVVRSEFDIGPGDILEWDASRKKIIITVRKSVGLEDIIGIFSKGGDAVKDKKRAQRGEL